MASKTSFPAEYAIFYSHSARQLNSNPKCVSNDVSHTAVTVSKSTVKPAGILNNAKEFQVSKRFPKGAG
jgi:hypothetical protein